MSRYYLRQIENREAQHFLEYVKGDSKRLNGFAKERRKYGFDSRETWSLDSTFYIWLYERLMMFKEKASKVVDLTFHKFEYKGETLTQIECIDRMIEGCRLFIEDSDTKDKEKQEKIKSVCEIWAIVIPAMWW